jgi:hypothetical protein
MSAVVVLCAWTLSWTALTPTTLSVPPRVSVLRADGAPSLREQMKAYLESVQQRGVELTPEQKAMIAEFEEDEELLDQTGRVDFMKAAQVLSPDEFALQQEQAASAAPAAPTSPAPAPATVGGSPTLMMMGRASDIVQGKVQAPPIAAAAMASVPPAVQPVPMPAPGPLSLTREVNVIDPQTARMWQMQKNERYAACHLLRKRAEGGLDEMELRELRKVLSSLVWTLTSPT